MTRSAKKGPFCDASLVKKVETAQANKDNFYRHYLEIATAI